MHVQSGEVLCGKIDAHAGEYATASFALGMLPMGSYWVKDGVPTEIRVHPRAVFAAYARWWFPVAIAVVGAKVPWRIAVPVSVGLALASAFAWSWRHMPRSRRRESDFNLAAFGLRCDAQRLLAQHRAELRALLQYAWEKRGGTRLPHEVAARGAIDTEEAVIAYGLLQLDGDRETARQIVAGYRKPAREHLYREAAPPPRVMIDDATRARIKSRACRGRSDRRARAR